MAISVKCPNPACGKMHTLATELAGKAVRCTFCQQVFKVPPAVPAPQPPDPLIGKQIAYYRIESLLGKGGMGKVYRAQNLRLAKTCAIKILPSEALSEDPTMAERFIREARSAATIQHPNVLPVHNVAKAEENYFIEMDYVDGGTLDGLMRQRVRLEVKEAARIIHDVAAGLQAAHEKGIIHRDIKPSNVMLTSKGHVYVMDFGLAKAVQAKTALTQQGYILGTPLYMSPEQATLQPVDHRSDIYSLGVMFYQILTGTPPYTAESPLLVLKQHESAPIPDITHVLPDIPPQIAAMIRKMMAKSPEERYQSCAEVVEELNAFLAAPAVGTGPAIVISDSTFEKAHEGRRAALFGKKKRSSVPLVLGLVFVLVLGGVVFYLATQPQRTKQKSSEFRGQSSVTPSDIQHPVSSIQHPEAPPPPSPEAGAVAPAPKQPPTPAAQRPTPVQAQTPAHTPTPAAPPAVAVAPSPSPIAVIQHPVSGMQHLAVDLVSYYDDSKQVNEKIGAADYDAARGQANLLKDKYPDLIATKLANLDRIESLRKRCFERVNSGAVKLTMGDISSRYAFAGEIKSADEGGLNGAIRKRWDSLSREDLLAFYRKASDPKSADDALGLAAFVMEGNVADKGYDAAVDLLGNAKALNAEIAPMMKYIETLKQAVKEYAEAEAKGKEVEGEGRKPALSKAEGAEGEKRQAEEKGPSSPAALPSSQSYDDVYVTTAATGEKIPHPLSKKVKSIVYMQKRVEIPEGMVYVPPGIFTMGEGESEHKVYLDAYFIGKYEVTNAEWKAFIDATAFTPLPPYWKGGQIPQGKENHPVVRVSWEDIQQYCEWVSKETGREVKLPTEAQWEKAARGPKAYIYPWGNQWNPRNCNWQGTWVGKYGLKFNPNEGVASDVWTAFTKSEKYTKEIYQELGGMTLPVGSFPKDRSFYACHDMAGNAYEWCADWFKTDYYKLQDAKRNPEGPNEEEAEEEDFSGKKSKARVLRGGSWYYNSGGCRTVYRTYAYPRAGKGQAWRAARQARP